MAGRLDGKWVALVVTDGFEQVELTSGYAESYTPTAIGPDGVTGAAARPRCPPGRAG